MNMTPDLEQPTPPATWKDFAATVKAGPDGERHPFFPLQTLDKPVEIVFDGNPVFDPTKFHGQYSLMEADIVVRGEPFRLCVSGARLASALAKVEPGDGSHVILTPNGTGKSRTWTAARAITATRL